MTTAHTARPATAPPTLPPGPQGDPIIGNLRRFANMQPQMFVELRAQYGDIYHLRVATRDVIFVGHPEMIKHVLVDNNRNYQKGFAYTKVSAFLGRGLLTSEGEFWRHQRRLAQPAFHQRRIEHFANTMVESTASMLEQWETLSADEPFDVSEAMTRLTLDIVTRTLFSTAVSPQEMDAVYTILPWLLSETDRRADSLLGLARAAAAARQPPLLARDRAAQSNYLPHYRRPPPQPFHSGHAHRGRQRPARPADAGRGRGNGRAHEQRAAAR